MTSLKPYLIRTFYEWIVDNGMTPYVLVNAEFPGSVIPRAYVQDGRIILNIRPEAVHNLALGNQEIEFNARFGGSPMHVYVPVSAVLGIYARENGKGMFFDEEESEISPLTEQPTPADEAAEKKRKPGKPFLTVVK